MTMKINYNLISGRAKVTNFEQKVQLLENSPEDTFSDVNNIALMLSHVFYGFWLN